ncbi:MAG TPA: hypothetical protein VKS82_01600 [Streptosporangiaceae bacterium]|nr:hypothetical protein [Streptosporangiaceae bacterium]
MRLTAVTAAVRQHWLLALLLAAGLVLRVLAQIAYRPALLYIDSYKYLYRSDGNDPVGYRALLKPVLAVANLDTVAGVQHLLGLGMAVALYALLLRRGTPRWLAALATAPILLDGYQLQAEQTIMPDVLFETLIVAGLVVLLWRPRPGLRQLALAGVLLGSSATVAQVGQIFIVPALVYVLIVAPGWRAALGHAALLCAAFALPILGYDTAAELVAGHFSLAHGGVTTFYGRAAKAADCQTLQLPAGERPLCPSRALVARLGIDGLEHSPISPLRPVYRNLPSNEASHLVSGFTGQVVRQQPLRVAGSVLADVIKLFAVDRVTSPGDTPISRWQFQTHYPVYWPYVTIHGGTIRIGAQATSGRRIPLGNTSGMGGGPVVVRPLAEFLRGYQLDGGYTPGPALLVMVLAGLIGSAALLLRRRMERDSQRDAARACLLMLAAAVCVLVMSDATEFSWRYQLPALVTLPPAGALGITVITGFVRTRRAGRAGPASPVASSAGVSSSQPG